jgi:hypothetical protein
VRIKHGCSGATLAIIAATIFGVICPVKAQEPDHRRVAPQKAILLSQIKHQDFAKANFNFGLGARGDSESPFTRNVYDVRYGGISLEGDNDWLDVPISHGSRSQIKDLGEFNWSDVYDIPFLNANPVPHSGEMSLSYNSGKLITVFPEGVLVRAVVGHMYLVHSKDENRDLYVMFRVEAVKPGDECTITWKQVPSPELW